MDSEDAARASAQLKHNKYMVFGKKYRYIEVFQCSGDDMNLVLNGGLHSPANPTKPPLLSPGMLPQTQHQATSPPSSSGIPLGIPPPLTLSIPPPNPALIAQQQAQYIAQQNLIARQQAAASVAAQAVAAASQQEPQYYLPNLALLPHHHPHPHQAQANQLAFAQQQHAYAPQFVLMPRPPHLAMQASAAAHHPQFQMGLMPTPFPHGLTFSTAGMTHPSQQPSQHPHHHHHHHHPVVSQHVSASIKRSYENAFQHEQANVSAPKRHFIRPTAAPPTNNIYAPFYPPNM